MNTHTNTTTWTVIVLALLLIAAGTQPAEAQFGDPSLLHIRLYGQGMPEPSTSGSSPEAAFQQAGLSISLFTLNLEYGFTHYQWSGVDKLSFGNGKDTPWENMHTLDLTGMYGGSLSSRWSYLALVGLSATFEDSDDDRPYTTGFLMGGGLYDLSEAWNLILGAGFLYADVPKIAFEEIDFLDDASKILPVPVLGFQWNQEAPFGLSVSLLLPVEAKVQLTTADRRISASVDGLAQSAEMHVRFSPRFGATATCSLGDSLTYRLANQYISTPLDRGEAYMAHESSQAALMLEMMLSDNFSIHMGPYYAFGQTLSIIDRHAEEHHKLKLDDAFGAKFEVVWGL